MAKHPKLLSNALEHKVISLSFLVAAKAVGAKGFKAVWTEVRGIPMGGDAERHCQGPQGFLCRGDSRYCISEKLKCNNVNNCGGTFYPADNADGDNARTIQDNSDEEDCKLHEKLIQRSRHSHNHYLCIVIQASKRPR